MKKKKSNQYATFLLFFGICFLGCYSIAESNGDKSNGDLLSEAVFNNDINSVNQLIRNGVDVDFQDDTGYTALMVAVMQNNIDMVNILIKSGANVNVKSNLGFTALNIADTKKNNEIKKVLILNGAMKGTGVEMIINAAERGDIEITKISDDGTTIEFKCKADKE